MGVLINPGNEAFAALNRSSYVDKTGVIKLINKSLETRNMLSCVCLPSGFGKSATAKTLAAYYDRACDSRSLFDDKKIAESDDYEEKLNQYNVLYIDMNYFAHAKSVSYSCFSRLIKESLTSEILGDCSTKRKERFESVEDNVERELIDVVRRSGKKFVVIVDGWDAVLRCPSVHSSDLKYDMGLANSWFNSATFTSKAVAGVVMTGTLPFRNDVFSQSQMIEDGVGPIPVFREYSLTQPGPFAEYFGFGENDVRKIAGAQSVVDLNRNYGGYSVENVGNVFNPASTLRAIEEGKLDEFWTEAYSSKVAADFIVKSENGLDETVAKLLDGGSVDVNSLALPSWCDGELEETTSNNEFLALMVYLGYLTYDSNSRTARIPNEEVKTELRRIVDRAQRAK